MKSLPHRKLIYSIILILVRHQHSPCSNIETTSLKGIPLEHLSVFFGQHLDVDALHISFTEGGSQVPYDFSAAALSNTTVDMLRFVKACLRYEEAAAGGPVRRREKPELERMARELNLLGPDESLPDDDFKLCCRIEPKPEQGSAVKSLTKPDGSPLILECDGRSLKHILTLIENRKDTTTVPHFELAVRCDLAKGFIPECNYCGRRTHYYDHHFRRQVCINLNIGDKQSLWMWLPRTVCEAEEKGICNGDGKPICLCPECRRRNQKRLTHLILPPTVLPFLQYSAEAVSNTLDCIKGRCSQYLKAKYEKNHCEWLLKAMIRACGARWERHRQMVLKCLKEKFNVGMAWRNNDKIKKQSGSRTSDCAENSYTADRYEHQTIGRLYAILLNNFIILYSTYYLFPLCARPIRVPD